MTPSSAPVPREISQEAAALAMEACHIIAAAVRAGHDNTPDLLLHLLEAADPAKAAIAASRAEVRS